MSAVLGGRTAALLATVAAAACGAPSADTSATTRSGSANASPPDAASSLEGRPLGVPTDPRARYYVLRRGGTAARPTILTRRSGPSGTGFSVREYDCARRLVRYLGTGDTRADAESGHPDPHLAPIVDGSIADYVGRAACQR